MTRLLILLHAYKLSITIHTKIAYARFLVKRKQGSVPALLILINEEPSMYFPADKLLAAPLDTVPVSLLNTAKQLELTVQ